MAQIRVKLSGLSNAAVYRDVEGKSRLSLFLSGDEEILARSFDVRRLRRSVTIASLRIRLVLALLL